MPGTRAREVRQQEGAPAAGLFSAKLGREIAYESQAELLFLEMLERSEDVLSYQEQPVAIPYSDGERDRVYYADVAVSLASGANLLVEIKARKQMALHQNLAKWRALFRYAHIHGLGFLVTDTRTTFSLFLNYEVDPSYRRTVLDALDEMPIGFTSYCSLFDDRHALPLGTNSALVIEQRLRFELAPFRLDRPAPV